MDCVISHEIPSDALASQLSAGNDDLFCGESNTETAGRENVTAGVVASQVSAGALRTPSQASRGSQHSLTASRPPAGDPGPGSLALQRRDAPLAHFMKSTAAASTTRAGSAEFSSGLTRVVEASRQSAGPGSLSHASSCAALIVLQLAAGLVTPSHLTPHHDFVSTQVRG